MVTAILRIRLFLGVLVGLISVGVMAAGPVKGGQSDIDGQVFIVQKNKQTVKLPLVAVFVATEEEVNKELVRRIDRANQVRKEKWLALEEQKERRNQARRDLQVSWSKEVQAKSALTLLQKKCKTTNANRVWDERGEEDCLKENSEALKKDQYEDALEIYEQAKIVFEKEEKEYKQNKAIFDLAKTPEAVFKGFEGSIPFMASVRTDADGRFSLKVPAGQRVALFAISSRMLMNETEFYRWMVWVEPGRAGEKVSIMLANHNLLETDCDDCVRYLPLIEPLGEEVAAK